LERLISASSNEGGVVLDPFRGCGTAIHAAQKLKREWIGIDITHLAISLIEKRLKDAFPGIKYEVHGTPKDLEGAHALAPQDKYQFLANIPRFRSSRLPICSTGSSQTSRWSIRLPSRRRPIKLTRQANGLAGYPQ
jgi:hypothetical protein